MMLVIKAKSTACKASAFPCASVRNFCFSNEMQEVKLLSHSTSRRIRRISKVIDVYTLRSKTLRSNTLRSINLQVLLQIRVHVCGVCVNLKI